MVLHFQESGNKDATLMVFLHGGGVSSWMWEKQIQYFTDYHCVSVDLPEQGRSDRKTKFSIPWSAEKIIELIEEIENGKKIVLIGFSLGAQVAIQILSENPDLIDYAILNSALVRPSPITKILIKPSIKLTYPLIKNKTFSKLQAKTLYLGKEFFDVYYQESSQMKSGTLVRILEENMSFALPNDLKKARGKILVTVGEKEKSIMKKSAFDIVGNNPNSTGIIIPNVGHGISLANPDYFNKMVEKWINDEILPEDSKEISRK